MKNPLISFVSAFFIGVVHAGEVTLEKEFFNISHEFQAMVLPDEVVLLRLDPEKWTSFEIKALAEHGSMVKKGDTLIAFDREKIDRQIFDTEKSIQQKELKLAEAKRKLKEDEETAEKRLEQRVRYAAEHKEDYTYFLNTDRAAQEESADMYLKRSEQMLAAYEEELRQLLQMYEEDDLTEETEEIILKRQRENVEFAKFYVRMQRLNHKRYKDVYIPQIETMYRERSEASARRANLAKEQIPRSIALQKLEIEQLGTALKRLREDLEALKKDVSLFEFTAPSAGTFYYGAMQDGSWKTGDRIKGLLDQKSAPIEAEFATFIPSSSSLSAHAFLGQKDALALQGGAAGMITIAGQEIPFTVRKIAQTPSPQNRYQITLDLGKQAGSLKFGQTLQARIISYEQEEAIVVKKKALRFSQDGWRVEVKLADGTTEWRQVTRGKASGDQVEITAGLELGQVIIVP